MTVCVQWWQHSPLVFKVSEMITIIYYKPWSRRYDTDVFSRNMLDLDREAYRELVSVFHERYRPPWPVCTTREARSPGNAGPTHFGLNHGYGYGIPTYDADVPTYTDKASE